MKNNLTPKDKSALKRCEDEIELRQKISLLIRDFSEKYDVVAKCISIEKNEFYNKCEDKQPPMYLIDIDWGFEYLGHPKK